MANELRGPLPVKVDATSNGEFRPVPLTEHVAHANSEAERRIDEHAKRVGIGRAFLQSLCGAATTFLTLNKAFAALDNTGGLFRLPNESAFEPAAAAEALAGDEFIFDVQTHMVDPAGAWRSSAGKYWEQILANFPQGSCGDEDPVDCFSAEKFIKHVFMDSDTDIAVLSFVPELPESNCWCRSRFILGPPITTRLSPPSTVSAGRPGNSPPDCKATTRPTRFLRVCLRGRWERASPARRTPPHPRRHLSASTWSSCPYHDGAFYQA